MEGGKLKSGVVGVGHERRVNALGEAGSIRRECWLVEASRGGRVNGAMFKRHHQAGHVLW